MFVFVLLLLSGVTGRDIWFCSSTAARDLGDLLNGFASAAPVTFGAISTIMLYGQQFYPTQCPASMCGPNTLGMFNSSGAGISLARLGKRVAIETGVVKDWGCNGRNAVGSLNLTLAGTGAFGITVNAIDMDESLNSGRQPPCSQPDSVTAQGVLFFTRAVSSFQPQISFNEVEPYPEIPAGDHVAWINTLVDQGTPNLGGYHLDVDFNAVRNKKIKNPCAEIDRIRQAAVGRGLTFGVIINGAGYPPPKSNSDYANYENTWISKFWSQGCARPSDRILFQSWEVGGVPSNLPEQDGTTGTGLVAKHAGL